MTTWGEFAEAAPALAAFGEERFWAAEVAYLATVRADGSPRVHPFTPILCDGRLFAFMEPTSPKGHDLRRDPRYSIHSLVTDQHGSEGEFWVSGRATGWMMRRCGPLQGRLRPMTPRNATCSSS